MVVNTGVVFQDKVSSSDVPPESISVLVEGVAAAPVTDPVIVFVFISVFESR